MKVYGWSSFRAECKTSHRQTREIVAAMSRAAAARAAGYDRPSQMFNLCETGNEFEIGLANTRPGTVFWKPINSPDGDYVKATGPR